MAGKLESCQKSLLSLLPGPGMVKADLEIRDLELKLRPINLLRRFVLKGSQKNQQALLIFIGNINSSVLRYLKGLNNKKYLRFDLATFLHEG